MISPPKQQFRVIGKCISPSKNTLSELPTIISVDHEQLRINSIQAKERNSQKSSRMRRGGGVSAKHCKAKKLRTKCVEKTKGNNRSEDRNAC